MNRLTRRLWRFSRIYKRDFNCSSGGAGDSYSSDGGSNQGKTNRVRSDGRGGVALTGASFVVVGWASMALMASPDDKQQDGHNNLERAEGREKQGEYSQDRGLDEDEVHAGGDDDKNKNRTRGKFGNVWSACLSHLLCKVKAEASKCTIGGQRQTCLDQDLSLCGRQVAGSQINEVERPCGLVLKKAFVFFRHGARTPILTIPSIEQANYKHDFFMTGMPFGQFEYKVVNEETGGPQPYSATEASYTPVILKGGSPSAQLTSLGHYQTYSLGVDLRKSYIEEHQLISSELNRDEIFLKSTNINRTIKSLCSVLAGLYGPVEIKKAAPVVIPVASDSNEVLIPKPSTCPNLLHYHMIAQKVAYCHSEMQYDRMRIEKILGMNTEENKHRIKWIEARDDLVARQVHGLPIPSKLEPYMDIIDKHATTMLYKSLCGMQKEDQGIATVLSCGKAIDLLLQHLGPNSKDSNYKLYLYSCHDSSLCALLGAFDIFDNKWPPFAADLRIELYEDPCGQQFVKVSYLSKDVVSRGCEEIYAPYDTFVKGLSPMSVDHENYTKLCNSAQVSRILSESCDTTMKASPAKSKYSACFKSIESDKQESDKKIPPSTKGTEPMVKAAGL
ncbi:lysophosphatidic acid phosphatase type 6-like isoform X2 [Argonauta hians]